MGEMIEVTASDGHTLGAYMAGDPDAAASVVIVQEIFGVNSHIRSVVDRFAALGYLAIAPAIFDRATPGLDLAYDDEGKGIGSAAKAQLDMASTLLDIEAAANHVRRDRPVALVGYCFGGLVAWLSANAVKLDAVVGYYGGGTSKNLDKAPNCPIMLQFGEADHNIPVEHVDAIRAAYPDVPVYTYPGAGHGFGCDQRDSYHAEATATAQERTEAFLSEHLAS
jgi:carboxymethylenebutenolidase